MAANMLSSCLALLKDVKITKRSLLVYAASYFRFPFADARSRRLSSQEEHLPFCWWLRNVVGQQGLTQAEVDV